MENKKNDIRFVDVVDNVLAPLALLFMGCILVYMFSLLTW